MSTALANLTTSLSQQFGMGDNGTELVNVLKATAFKGPASEAQLTALMVVANQYGLNPWTREIYAFPDRNNGIVPVVGVDGWSRIINENKNFDGMEFSMSEDGEECTCTIYRKDRNHPISVTEYFSECRRDNTQPWKSHPRRMLRHKAMIQCARLAFGYVGIYDQDEAERIAEIDITPGRQTGTQAAAKARPSPAEDSAERMKLIADLEALAESEGIERYAKTWALLTKEQRKMVGADEHDRLKRIAESIPMESAGHE